MNQRLMKTAEQVEKFATKYNVAEASEIVRSLLDGNAPMLIVANDLQHAAPFRDENFPDAELVRPEDLLVKPWRALPSPRVFAAYKCGENLSVDAAAVVEQVFFPRPRGTYAFVILGCGRLDSSELEVVERSAWRLLVPEPKPRWAQQDLSEHDIYFWDSNAEGPASLKSQQALDAIRAVGASSSSADSITTAALSVAVDKIQAAAEASLYAADSPSVTRRKLINLQQEMKNLARRLVRNAERQVELFSQTMDTSVLRLRNDLNHGLSQALRGDHGSVLMAPDRGALREHLQHYLDQGTERWLSDMRSRLSDETEEMIAEASSIFRATDWSELNRIAEENGEASDRPASIVARLNATSGPNDGRPALDRPGREPGVQMPAASFAIGGTGLVLGLGFLVGPVTAIVTSVLLGAAAWRVYQERGVHEYEGYGGGVILGVTEQMRVHAEELADGSLGRFKSAMEEEFQHIDKLLTGQISRGAAEGEPKSRDLETLSSLRDSLGTSLTAASAQ